MTFQGPVNIVGGRIDLKGDNSATFTNKVRVQAGGLHLRDAKSQATVTLSGRGNITASRLQVFGGNRLVFSLSSVLPTNGFINADCIAVDIDCLVIDNPEDVLKKDTEIILIRSKQKIDIKGDKRKIVTRQLDEFELLVDDNRISAKLIERASDLTWDDLKSRGRTMTICDL